MTTFARQVRGFLLLAAVCSCPALLSAQTIPPVTPSSQTSVYFVHGESGGRAQQESGTYDSDTTFTDPDTQDLYFGNGSASVSVSADPDKGSHVLPDLHAFAHAMANGNSEAALAQATFTDNLIFNAPAVDTVKVYRLNFLITGSLSGNSNATLNVSWGNIDSNGITITDSSFGAQELTLNVPSNDLTNTGSVVGGLFTISLAASANNTIPNSFNTEDSVANFSDTVQLVSADAVDANGNAVQGTFTDDSGGIDFSANTVFVTVPEPATLLLLAPVLGLLMVFGQKWRRGAQST